MGTGREWGGIKSPGKVHKGAGGVYLGGGRTWGGHSGSILKKTGGVWRGGREKAGGCLVDETMLKGNE